MVSNGRDLSSLPVFTPGFSLNIPARRISLIVIPVLLAAASVAQQQPPAAPEPDAQTNPADSIQTVPEQNAAPIIVPTGTRLALVLTHPVDSKTMHRGDAIYAQITAPIAVGEQVVIPAGSFVQGQVEKLRRDGNRCEFLMQSVSLLFPNGYVASITGPTNIETDEGTAWRNPGNAAKTGAFAAPFVGAGLGAAMGSAAHTTQSSTLGGTTITTGTPKGIAIGSVVGMAAGGIVSVVLLARSRDFYVEVGSPMEMDLPQPLTLAENQVADAVRQAQSQPAAPMPIARRPPPPLPTDHGTCYTPDTPGTPPTIIPGTQPIGNSPGTPDIVIPGTPSIPGSAYPCP